MITQMVGKHSSTEEFIADYSIFYYWVYKNHFREGKCTKLTVWKLYLPLPCTVKMTFSVRHRMLDSLKINCGHSGTKNKKILLNVHALHKESCTVQIEFSIKPWVIGCYMSHNPLQKASPLLDQRPGRLAGIQ